MAQPAEEQASTVNRFALMQNKQSLSRLCVALQFALKLRWHARQETRAQILSAAPVWRLVQARMQRYWQQPCRRIAVLQGQACRVLVAFASTVAVATALRHECKADRAAPHTDTARRN